MLNRKVFILTSTGHDFLNLNLLDNIFISRRGRVARVIYLLKHQKKLRLEIEMTFEDELSGAKCDWYFRYDR